RAHRRTGSAPGVARPVERRAAAHRRRAGRPAARPLRRHGAGDGGGPAGRPRWGRRRARRRRPGGPLHAAGSVHGRGLRNDGGRVTSLVDRWDRSLMGTYGTPSLALVGGQGAVVTDDRGRPYVDLLAGLAVNSL